MVEHLSVTQQRTLGRRELEQYILKLQYHNTLQAGRVDSIAETILHVAEILELTAEKSQAPTLRRQTDKLRSLRDELRGMK